MEASANRGPRVAVERSQAKLFAASYVNERCSATKLHPEPARNPGPAALPTPAWPNLK